MVIPRRLVNITVPVLNNKPGGGHKATRPPNLIDDDEGLHASFLLAKGTRVGSCLLVYRSSPGRTTGRGRRDAVTVTDTTMFLPGEEVRRGDGVPPS